MKTNLTYPSAKHTGKWSTTCEALRPRVSLGNAFTRISSKWLSGIVLKTVSTSDKTQSPTKFSPQWTIFLTWLLDTIRKGPAKCGPKIVCASFGSHVLCMQPLQLDPYGLWPRSPRKPWPPLVTVGFGPTTCHLTSTGARNGWNGR